MFDRIEQITSPIRWRNGRWFPTGPHAKIERDGWSARPAPEALGGIDRRRYRQAVAALAPNAPEIGLLQIADAPRHVLRIARDKALLVTSAPIDMRFGWNASGWSTTPADSMYRLFDLSGRAMRQVLTEATASDLDLGSPSAAILFAGVPALLYRAAPDVARLAVETGYAPYVWRWLETRKG